MKYILTKDGIEICDREDFDIKQILECGQVFSFEEQGDGFVVLSANKKAEVMPTSRGYFISTNERAYFENYFDLKTDYTKIKKTLLKFPIMQKPVEFGKGIRILKQDLFEALISFIISANNNIKRIQMILERLRRALGENMGDLYAFPTSLQMRSVGIDFFKDIGAGYRAEYLFKVVRQIDEGVLEDWRELKTKELRNKLIALAGVGPKVADCVLLFGYGRQDVFPVDTWIQKMYEKFYGKEKNREQIRNNLIKEFGALSGYAQQYLFYSMRSKEV